MHRYPGLEQADGLPHRRLGARHVLGQPLTSSRQRVVTKCIKDSDNALRVAVMLKAGSLLVVPGAVNIFFDPSSETVRYDDAIKRSMAALKKIARSAAAHKIHVGIENVWNKMLLSPLEMRSFVDDIGSRYLGVYFDVGNVILTGFPEHWIRILGRRIKRVHLKDFKWEFVPDVKKLSSYKGFARGQCWGTRAALCDLGAGDVNWREVMKALKAVRYRGPVTAEMLPPEPGVLRRTSKAMDIILGRRKT